jgi:putative component of membrane protein insertase Oxa1/YidC/SpoIIIJ protein YidD
MAMNEQQTEGLEILETGQAAVFSEGSDGAVLVQVPSVKKGNAVYNDEVQDHMRSPEIMTQTINPYPMMIERNVLLQCRLIPVVSKARFTAVTNHRNLCVRGYRRHISTVEPFASCLPTCLL